MQISSVHTYNKERGERRAEGGGGRRREAEAEDHFSIFHFPTSDDVMRRARVSAEAAERSAGTNGTERTVCASHRNSLWVSLLPISISFACVCVCCFIACLMS